MAKIALNGKHYHLISFGKWRKSHAFLDWMINSISSFLGINRKPGILVIMKSLSIFVSGLWCQPPSCNYLIFRWAFDMSPCCISHLWRFSISIPKATAWKCQGACLTNMREVTWAISSSPCRKKCLTGEIIIFCRWTGLFGVQLQEQVVSK